MTVITSPMHDSTMSPEPVSAWPLIAPHTRRRGRLTDLVAGVVRPDRLRRLPGDVLIGMPLSLVGHLVGRNERVRRFADVD
jgi:hypothetical protein